VLFQWGYRASDGSGLSYGYEGLMQMPLADVYWLIERMGEEREANATRHRRAIDEAQKGRKRAAG
jgi:hypothetical protein